MLLVSLFTLHPQRWIQSNINSKSYLKKKHFQVRYVYQCKGTNVTFSGQFFLGLYIACHAVTRLTVTIAMFSTAEDSGKSGVCNDPNRYYSIFKKRLRTVSS